MKQHEELNRKVQLTVAPVNCMYPLQMAPKGMKWSLSTLCVPLSFSMFPAKWDWELNEFDVLLLLQFCVFSIKFWCVASYESDFIIKLQSERENRMCEASWWPRFSFQISHCGLIIVFCSTLHCKRLQINASGSKNSVSELKYWSFLHFVLVVRMYHFPILMLNQ